MLPDFIRRAASQGTLTLKTLFPEHLHLRIVLDLIHLRQRLLDQRPAFVVGGMRQLRQKEGGTAQQDLRILELFGIAGRDAPFQPRTARLLRGKSR